jgi:predicted kinase
MSKSKRAQNFYMHLHKNTPASKVISWLMNFGSKQLIMLIGLPASGKSLLAQRLVAAGAVAFSRDEIRAELYGDEAIHGNTEEVNKIYYQRIAEALALDKVVIADGVHSNYVVREPVLALAHAAHCDEITIVYLDATVKTCLHRNKRRKRVVGEKIIYELHAQLQTGLPEENEGRFVVLKPGKNIRSYRVTCVRAKR